MTPAEILTTARDRLTPPSLGPDTPSLKVKPEALGNALNMQCDSHAQYLRALFALRQTLGLHPNETLYSFCKRFKDDITLSWAVGSYNVAIMRVREQEQTNG